MSRAAARKFAKPSPAFSGRGVTVYRGRGGLTNVEQDILYCVVTRLEIGKIKTIARGIDESAFIVSHALSDVEGGVVKKTRCTWTSARKAVASVLRLLFNPLVGHQPHQRDPHVNRIREPVIHERQRNPDRIEHD